LVAVDQDKKMRIFSIPKQISLGIGMVALAFWASAVSGCFWTRQSEAALPVETIGSRSGQIMSFRAHETPDRLYVTGQAKPHQLTRPMHVDIQLIGTNGQVIAETTDDLDAPRHPRVSSGGHGRQPYVASFPLSEARQAVKIRVLYHERHRGQSDR
jgi:hypothetical protein